MKRGYVVSETIIHSSEPNPGARRTLFALAVVALIAGTVFWAVFLRSQTDAAPGREVRVTVPAGAGTDTIGRILVREGVVSNRAMFSLRVRFGGAEGKLKAGVYDLVTGMGYRTAIDRLLEGPPVNYINLTIPEGFVVEQVAKRVEKLLYIPESEFLKLAKGGAASFAGEHPYLADAYEGSLEGYLFPKTYEVREGSDARSVIELMLDQFDAEIATVDLSRAAESGLSQEQVVVMASIIEREAQLDKERPLVASVMYNRLAAGMLLEIDATIEYVLPGNRFRLRYSDLKLDSPYNTYRYKGLPPGPISNPGLASIRAAADPAKTKYLYYVLTGKDGSHTFTPDLESFLKAKEKSKEVFGR